MQVVKINLNIIYLISILFIALIILGVVPRWLSFVLLLFWIVYSVFAPFENAVSLFIRNIPFFIALPITVSFDNFNSWRVISIIVFIRWLAVKFRESDGDTGKKSIFSQIKIQNLGDSIAKIISVPVKIGEKVKQNFWHIFWTEHKIGYLIFILFIFAVVSLFAADYLFVGIKRIIYFVNLLLIPIVIADLIKNKNYFEKLIIDIFWVASFVILIGYLQLLSVYILNFAEFMYFWADTVERNLFGRGWADIVMGANTWFAYNLSSALKLRVFSIFPDSHSFPLFLLSVLPFILASFFRKKKIYPYIFFFFLILILTGTRGIWAAFILPISYLLFETAKKNKLGANLFIVFLIFFLSFGAAYLILQKPQFMPADATEEEKADIIKRVSSIVDLDETSNFGRIQIWRKTFNSLIRRPLFGVGIGNFPIVLQEEIATARAGASAHNLYLNIAAEMGILAGLVFLWLFWEILKRVYFLWKRVDEPKIKLFALGGMASLLWICGYNLTDAALFDERAFLMFGVLTATILALHRHYSQCA